MAQTKDFLIEIGCEAIRALLGGVIERAVAEFARNDERQLHGGGVGLCVFRGFVLRLAAAGKQTEQHDCRKEQCKELFHDFIPLSQLLK